MTAANQYFAYDFKEAQAVVPWDLDHRAAWMPSDADYFADVLRHVDAVTSGLRFVLTWKFDIDLPFVGNDVVVICLADELARMPLYAHDVGLVCRTYASVRPSVAIGPPSSWPGALLSAAHEARLQTRRLPYSMASARRTVRRRRRPKVLPVPVGIYQLADQPFVPFAEREYDASFIGSERTNVGEWERRRPSVKARSRQDLFHAARLVERTRPDLRLAVSSIASFPYERSEDVSYGYSRLMMQSRIALCPRGSSLETYRFFEAIKFGCVPVTEPLPALPFYEGSPAVRLLHWSSLPRVLDRLFSDPAALERRHQDALAWWNARCAPSAVAGEIVAALEGSRSVAPKVRLH